MTRSKLILLSLGVLLMSGCISHLRPYTMDVRQGNYITPEMREKLKLGMSKQQVRYVMGTPLLTDPFHGDRWDYRYSLAERGAVVEQQGMTLYFQNDNLARIDDAAMPPLPPQPVAEPVSEMPAASAVPAVLPEPAMVAPVVSADAQVKASLAAWAAAWSARDSKRYLASYSPSFQPVDISRSAWQEQRQQRIGQAKSIAVSLSDVVVQMQDDNHAQVTYTQTYHSDHYQDVEHKLMTLEKSGDTWLIVTEIIEK